ncbi:sugar ABC transporter substrate-binding protein [Ktedonobacteria bacterium brp13]|nr:sugar ABC transporter substrate-binding protein [Ktedonobacteria bacterium brp13]
MEQYSYWQRAKQLLITGLVISTIFLAGCNTNSQMQSGASGPDGANGKGCNRVGVLLPDTTSSPRWEQYDHPLLIGAIDAAIPGVHIDYNNAHGVSDTQIAVAKQDLAQGDCILVISSVDSVASAQIVSAAKAQNVPVIAYDRLIESSATNYYVSFDGVAVGKLQAQYIVDNYQKFSAINQTTGVGHTNVFMISGSQTDTNALLFSKGVHEILDPYFADKTLTFQNEVFTPGWSGPLAATEAAVALSNASRNIQILYVANDDMAANVIDTMTKMGINNSGGNNVLITGQDASVVGIRNILLGNQSMTVYKPVVKETLGVGALVKALHNGTSTAAITGGQTSATSDGGSIPSVLVQPIPVDITNIRPTVLKDNYVKLSDICQGVTNAAAASICTPHS